MILEIKDDFYLIYQDCKQRDEFNGLRVKFRSQTFAYNAARPERSKVE